MKTENLYSKRNDHSCSLRDVQSLDVLFAGNQMLKCFPIAIVNTGCELEGDNDIMHCVIECHCSHRGTRDGVLSSV